MVAAEESAQFRCWSAATNTHVRTGLHCAEVSGYTPPRLGPAT